jgi:hypothetical protein
MDSKDLVDICEDIYSSHTPANISLDSHLEAELIKRSLQDSEGGELVSQIVYGAFRYSRFLNAFLEAFYHHNR